MKGTFDENQETWRLTSKKWTTCTWTGPSEDEFSFFLNGYFLDTWLQRSQGSKPRSLPLSPRRSRWR